MQRSSSPGRCCRPYRSAALVLVGLLAVMPAAGHDAAADPPAYAVLLIGNSHSTKAGLPKKLERLLAAIGPETAVVVEVAPGWRFLDERLDDRRTQALLDSRAWSHVVLQAQRYSTSGRWNYPTEAAEEWIRRVRTAGAVPILFPEWGLLGNEGETLRVQRLHERIATAEPACVAPIGLAWEVALDNRPGLRLHAADGNHANKRGALLAAYVLYEVVSGHPAAALPDLGHVGVSRDDQAYLRRVATSLLEKKTACPDERKTAGRDGR